MPVRLRCRVRGIGVAVRVSRSTSARSFLSRSLCATPKRLLFVDDHHPRFLERTSCCSRRWVPMRMSIRPAAVRARISFCSLGVAEPRKHLDGHREIGQTLTERLQMLAASTVVGTAPSPGGSYEHHFEGGADRHLGLAVANVAADRPIDRLCPIADRPAPASIASSWSGVSS